jgi:hypothetical protein
MSYKDFTWSKVKADFDLRAIEGQRFFPDIPSSPPSPWLQTTLDRGIPWATAVGSEKARSEAIINPILLEVRDLLNQTISVFSGEDFSVDSSVGLNGYCDFLISKSSEQLAIEAPAVVIVEAKRDDIKSGLGQCAAAMVAAQRFNQAQGQIIPIIYGAVSNGTVWRFLQLEGQTIAVDLRDYAIPPVDQILAFLVWMLRSNGS